MELSQLLVLLSASAVVVHVARYWRPLGFIASVGATGILLWAVRGATGAPYELLGLAFQLQPLARDYLFAALAVSGALAVATSLGDTRRSLGFMFWSWSTWLIALTVNDFVVGVFAWATGLAAMVIAMEPRRIQRVGGAAYFLVLVIVGTAALLVGHRFAQLYPLTPDQLSLLQSSVLFLTWGLGLLLGAVPFMLWLGPMADETPLPIIVALLGLGQPIGLWLLYGLVGQYPRLLELTNLITILTYGGIAAVVVGGGLCALERRAGRLMSFAALYALGFVLLDLSRGTLEGAAFAVVETFARAVGLGLMAASVTVARAFERRWVKLIAVPVFLLGALTLAGLAPGVSLASRWNLLLEFQATGARIFSLLMLSTVGILVGAARFVMLWLQQILPPKIPEPEYEPFVVDVPPPTLPRLTRARYWLGAQVRRAIGGIVTRIPLAVRRAANITARQWRPLAAALLLTGLSVFVLYYSWTPQIWLQRALDTVAQLAFLR